MANSVTFLTSVGGDGSTVTDDANPTTGLANSGHRKRFVPALSQVVAVAQHVVDTAEDVNVDKLAAQQAVIDAQAQVDLAADQVALAAQQVSLAGSQAGIATTKAGEAAASALSASNSAIAASDSADEAEYWAGQAGAAATGGVKVSATDTTAGSLSNKLVVADGLTATILNAGGNEQLQIKADGLQQEIAASSGLSYFSQGVI